MLYGKTGNAIGILRYLHQTQIIGDRLGTDSDSMEEKTGVESGAQLTVQGMYLHYPKCSSACNTQHPISVDSFSRLDQ